MIKIKVTGSYDNTRTFLARNRKINALAILHEYGQKGVDALASATPIDTGKTASSWSYSIVVDKGSMKLSWTNSNIAKGIPVAILLQYGHATRNGAFVQGIDFINPALSPIFEQMAESMWKEVTE